MPDEKQGLFNLMGRFEAAIKDLPPVDNWNPELSGDMDMVIKASGDWVHEGSVIERDKLSRLFSSIIKKEGADYFLVTPVEKWRIQVEDQPFIIALGELNKEGISLITNMGDSITLTESDQLVMDDDHEAPRVLVRSNLYARLNRSTYYQLAELAKEEGGQYYIESNGTRFYISQ